ncbi:MAG: response regulator [Bacteroidales bacterium]
MVRKYLVFFTLAFLVGYGQLAQANEDAWSLLAQLAKTEGNDKYEVCRQLVKLFEGTDDKTALKYALMMEETAAGLKDEYLLAQARLQAADLMVRISDFNRASVYIIRALEYLVVKGTLKEVAEAYFISGTIHLAQMNYSLAAEHYGRALRLFERIGDVDGEVKAYSRLASLFEGMKDFDLVRKYALKAYQLAQEPQTRISALTKYGIALSSLDSVDKAINYLTRLSDSLLEVRDFNSALKARNVLNKVLIDHGKIEDARKIIIEDIRQAEEVMAYSDLGILYTRLAHVYDLQGDLSQMVECNRKALYYRELASESYTLASSLNNLANNMMRLGRFREALGYFRRANRLAHQTGNVWILDQTFGGLALYYLKTQKIDSLYYVQQQRSAILDSIRKSTALSEARVLLSLIETRAKPVYWITKSPFQTFEFWISVVALLLISAGTIIGLLLRYRRMKQRFRQALKEARILNLNLEKRIIELQEKHQDDELKLKALIDYTPVGIGLVDASERFIFANPALCLMLGYQAQEMLGKNLKDFMTSEEFNRLAQLTTNRRRGIAETYTVNMRKKDGNPIEVQVSASPYFNAKGEFAGTLGIIQDLTERNVLVANLEKALDKAMESDRLKSSFLAVMSHEIRTPLNAILNGVELVFSNEMDEEERGIIIREIHQSARTLLEMWDNLILLSKLRAGLYVLNKKWVRPADLLREKMEEFLGLIPREKLGNLDWITEIKPDENFEVYTDAEIIQRSIHCLISNAIKFTDKGTIQVNLTFEKRQLELVVEDTGKGISNQEMQYVFSYFRQGEEGMTRSYGGAGIGLSIVKDLIDKVSGTIDVVSEPGRGTRVKVIIPAAIRKVKTDEPLKETSQGNAHPDWRGKTILVAEDTESNFQFLKTVLRKYGAEVLWAREGPQVLEILNQHPEINLVLMDIHMPGISGLEATTRIRKFNPNIIIIAQTAYAMIHDREETLRAGCNDYIAKPIRLPVLIEMLNHYLK